MRHCGAVLAIAVVLATARVYHDSQAASDTGARAANSPAVLVTPAQYLASSVPPLFKMGNTLPPLTRWGWQLDYDTMVRLVLWGYALDFGEANDSNVKALDDPSSLASKLVALVHDAPSLYKLSVLMPRRQLDDAQPPSAYLHDASGNLIDPHRWSPQAPDDLLQSLAGRAGALLRAISSKAPIAVVLDGGERGLAVPAQIKDWASGSPDVLSAKGSLSWYDYVSRQKAHQEQFFTNAAHEATKNAIYIFYPTGNQYAPRTTQEYDWDYKWMQRVADYPSGSFYYRSFNNGWTAGWFTRSDILTQVLNEHGYDTALGHPLAYHWVNDGWPTNPDDPSLGDLKLYTGFLKSTYTAGMVGAVAGYFAYPKGGFAAKFPADAPPHWLLQMLTLGQVHAEFSYLEDMLRDADLLPGPMHSRLTPSQPAYEFPTGFTNTRVLVRKMKNRKRWLISVWAADGVDRTVNVDIPAFGVAAVRASAAGALYDARIVKGDRQVTVLDAGSMTPTPLLVPSSEPDSS